MSASTRRAASPTDDPRRRPSLAAVDHRRRLRFGRRQHRRRADLHHHRRPGARHHRDLPRIRPRRGRGTARHADRRDDRGGAGGQAAPARGGGARAASSGRLRPFVVEPEVTVNNQWSDRYTVIEVPGSTGPACSSAHHRDLEAQPQHRVRPRRDLRRACPRRVLRHRPARRPDHRSDAAGRDQARADPFARQRRCGEQPAA